jgi:hypothetical protein
MQQPIGSDAVKLRLLMLKGRGARWMGVEPLPRHGAGCGAISVVDALAELSERGAGRPAHFRAAGCVASRNLDMARLTPGRASDIKPLRPCRETVERWVMRFDALALFAA